MILGENELLWQHRVESAAVDRGWAVYRQSPAGRSHRQHMPSVVLARGQVVLLVFLRTRLRADRMPPVAELAAATGLQVVAWSPDRWSEVVATLTAPSREEVRKQPAMSVDDAHAELPRSCPSPTDEPHRV